MSRLPASPFTTQCSRCGVRCPGGAYMEDYCICDELRRVWWTALITLLFRVALGIVVALLAVLLIDRAWAYEQASFQGHSVPRIESGGTAASAVTGGDNGPTAELSVAPDWDATPTLSGASAVGNEAGSGAAIPSVGVPTALTLAQASVPSAAPHGEQTTLTESSSRTATWPTREAMRWQPPRGFLRAAFCIHRFESVDWYRAYVDWRGYPSVYSGGMQFTLSTWRRAGGSGHPHQWRPREQVYRAWRIWRRNGGSWREWGTAWKCGLS